MELQPPQSPLSTIISQEPKDKKFNETLLDISKKISDADDKKIQSNKELKELLLVVNTKLDDASNPLIINVSALKNIEELQQQNTQLLQRITTLSNNHQCFITTNNQDRKWFGLVGICTALGLSINFIMFAYLWYYTHK
jgi:hypothetical protein